MRSSKNQGVDLASFLLLLPFVTVLDDCFFLDGDLDFLSDILNNNNFISY
jgi:hypothetical protein